MSSARENPRWQVVSSVLGGIAAACTAGAVWALSESGSREKAWVAEMLAADCRPYITPPDVTLQNLLVVLFSLGAGVCGIAAIVVAARNLSKRWLAVLVPLGVIVLLGSIVGLLFGVTGLEVPIDASGAPCGSG